VARAGQPADRRHLGLADKTVRNQLSRLYQRLGVEGRTHAVVRARELGF
jgi:DNA-binding NarL/FixJ family response regulator